MQVTWIQDELTWETPQKSDGQWQHRVLRHTSQVEQKLWRRTLMLCRERALLLLPHLGTPTCWMRLSHCATKRESRESRKESLTLALWSGHSSDGLGTGKTKPLTTYSNTVTQPTLSRRLDWEENFQNALRLKKKLKVNPRLYYTTVISLICCHPWKEPRK